MMRENGRMKKAARRFKRYVYLKRQTSLNRMRGEDRLNDSIEETIIALEMRFPKYSEAYARI